MTVDMPQIINKLLNNEEHKPGPAGFDLILVLVLSVLIGIGVSYVTLGFMNAFDEIINRVYFQWSEYPSGQYSCKIDSRNRITLNFQGDNKHGLAGLAQLQWAQKGQCRIVVIRDGTRQEPILCQWVMDDAAILVQPPDGQKAIDLRYEGKDLVISVAETEFPWLPILRSTETVLFQYKQGSFSDVPKWHILTALVLGGLCIGLLYGAFRLTRAHGPADAIIARIANDGMMPMGEGIVTALICVVSIGLGASVGRYGPAVHLGATLGSGFAKAFRMGRINRITFLGCGVASAIATSFNTPIAATIFTHEVIIRHYSLRAFAPITIAAVTGNALAVHHGRLFDGFQNLTAPAELSVSQYPLFAIVGLITAAFSLIYMHSLLAAEKLVKRLHVPLWIRPACAGLAIGIVAIWLPNLMGLVEETTTQVIQDEGEQYVFQMLCFLIVFKIASTAFCLSCGMHGGIFGPSLCIGAMVGAACALATVPSYYPIFALAGMGACISSVIGAPISTILIVFELNQNYSVATAVMVAVVVSNLITNRFFSRSFFVHQVFTAGFDVNAGREVLILQRRRIQEVMQRNFQVLSPDASLQEVEKALHQSPDTDIYVTEKDSQKLLGSITLGKAWDVLKEPERHKEKVARDLVQLPRHILTEETDLNTGFEIIAKFVGVSIPVVNNRNDRILTGIVYEANVIQAYNDAVKQARREEQGLD